MGFNGAGIAQAPVGSRIIASLVLEHRDCWSESGLVGLERRRALPPEPVRYLGARLVRAAIARKNEAEIVNRTPGKVTQAVLRMIPGHTGQE